MARGKSGRIVIEIDPTLKRRLRAALDLDNLTLKEWFVQQAIKYLEDHEDLGHLNYGPLFTQKQTDVE